MKIIFLNCVPISTVFGQKVDVSWYENNGFQVEYWDLSPLYYDQSNIDLYFSGAIDYKYTAPNHRYFHSRDDVEAQLQLQDKNTIVFNLSRHEQACLDDFWLLRLLKILDIVYFVQKIENSFDAPHSFKDINGKISYIRERIYPYKQLARSLKVLKSVITLKLKTLIFDYSEYYAKPAIAVGVGKKGRRSFNHLVSKGVRYVSIASPSIHWNTNEKVNSAGICLFVDESIGYEPDVKLDDMATVSDLESYYERLKKVFSLVENVTGLQVVVGASGKVKYNENPFDREIFYKQTLQLAETSAIAIGHSSSALYHCLCSNLPVLLLDDNIFTTQKKKCINDLASAAKLKIYDSSCIERCDIENIIMQGVPDNFVEEYFKEPQVNEDYRTLIAQAVRELLN